jgi:hypothetical protein
VWCGKIRNEIILGINLKSVTTSSVQTNQTDFLGLRKKNAMKNKCFGGLIEREMKNGLDVINEDGCILNSCECI